MRTTLILYKKLVIVVPVCGSTQVLSLSTESWTERALSTSPSLSDSSPSLPSTPLSPYNDREDNGPFSLGQVSH